MNITAAAPESLKKTYQAPLLTEHGELRELTQATSNITPLENCGPTGVKPITKGKC